MTDSSAMLSFYHPMIAQAIILLFTFALICDLIGLMNVRRAISVADWLIILGASLCFPALFTGYYAANTFYQNASDLQFHVQIAYAISVFAIVYAIVRLIFFFKNYRLPPLVYVILTVALVYLTSWTTTIILKQP